MGPPFRQQHATPFGQGGDGFGKGQVFVLHDEVKDIAADTTTEAMKDLFLAGDREGGRLLGMEGAEGFEISTAALEREVLRDDIDDVAASTNLLDDFLRDMFSHDSALCVRYCAAVHINATRGVPFPVSGLSRPYEKHRPFALLTSCQPTWPPTTASRTQAERLALTSAKSIQRPAKR